MKLALSFVAAICVCVDAISLHKPMETEPAETKEEKTAEPMETEQAEIKEEKLSEPTETEKGETNKEKAAPKRTKVEIFYETECPDCMKVIYEELKPVWEDETLRSRIELVMYPFGNAMIIPTTEISEGYKYWHSEVTTRKSVFVCQHGETECLGNMIHACIMQKNDKDPDKYLPFVFCMEGKTRDGVEKKSFECAEEHGYDMEELRSCVDGLNGNALMTSHGRRTLEQKVDHVPWILIDDVHEEKAEDGEFLRTLCGVWGDDKPVACDKAPKKPKEEAVPQQQRGGQPMLVSVPHDDLQKCDAREFPIA